ncbi:hypothetical protein CBL_20692 [Carabus blaptoides fortunei]
MTKSSLSDLPSGPLDRYRAQSSFDWKTMKLFIESEELIEETNKIVETMQENVILHPTTNEMSLDEIRHISTKRLYNLIANRLMAIEKAHANPRIQGHVIRVLFHWDPASSARYLIGNIMCLEVLRSLGSERHNHYVQDTLDGKVNNEMLLSEEY